MKYEIEAIGNNIILNNVEFEVELKNIENFTFEDCLKYDKYVHDLKFRNIMGNIIKEFGRETKDGFILDF